MSGPRVFETVVEDLAAAIRCGELIEGGRLPSERDLVTRFGVSRMSIREALLSLEAMGLIDIRARSRATVRPMRSETFLNPLAAAAKSVLATPEGVADFQNARTMFEGGLARYAADYASPKEIERLGQALLANRRAIGNPQLFTDTDVRFHAILAEIPQNGIFVGLNAALTEWLAGQRTAGLEQPGSDRVAYAHHERIFEAIAARSPEAADKAMEEHLAWVGSLNPA